MKKIYDFLGILIGVSIGVFLGRSGFAFWHYKTYPEFYAIQSAPWYTPVLFNGVFMVVTVAAALLVRWVLRKRMEGKAVNG